MSDFTTRAATVTLHDRYGFHVVRAEGDAGTWFACTRSAEVGFRFAVYAATFGELPASDWECDPSDATPEAPFSVSWKSEDDAVATFRLRESVWTASLRGTLAEGQPFADDLTDAQWSTVESGGAAPLGEDRFAVLCADHCAHVLRSGVEYVSLDGIRYVIPADPFPTAVPTDTGRFHGPCRVDDATMGTLRRIREIRRESGASCVAFARGVGRGVIVVRCGHRDRRHAFAARLLAEGMSFCYPADDPRALYVRPSTRYAAL